MRYILADAGFQINVINLRNSYISVGSRSREIKTPYRVLFVAGSHSHEELMLKLMFYRFLSSGTGIAFDKDEKLKR